MYMYSFNCCETVRAAVELSKQPYTISWFEMLSKLQFVDNFHVSSNLQTYRTHAFLTVCGFLESMMDRLVSRTFVHWEVK